MKLEYFELISPAPMPLLHVGSVKPPTLRDIQNISRRVYETYLSFLSLSPMKFCTDIDPGKKDWFENLSDGRLSQLTMYDIAASSPELSQMYSHILDFFFLEHVVFCKDRDAFLVFRLENETGGGTAPTPPGIINKSNFSQITDIILQLNHMNVKNHVDLSRVKSVKGRTRYLRMQRAKAGTQQAFPQDSDIELGNIISVVCTRHKSINYLNVWDLTIYQLWDIFTRLQAENAYELNKTSVAVWGNKENRFDVNSWYQKLL